jgi:hypothetical protein
MSSGGLKEAKEVRAEFPQDSIEAFYLLLECVYINVLPSLEMVDIAGEERVQKFWCSANAYYLVGEATLR